MENTKKDMTIAVAISAAPRSAPPASEALAMSANGVVARMKRTIEDAAADGLTTVDAYVDSRFASALAEEYRSKGYQVRLFGADGDILADPDCGCLEPTYEGNYPELEIRVSW